MDQDDDGDDGEYETLNSRITMLARREANGKITDSGKLELFKLRKNKIAKDRLRAAARGEELDVEQEAPLFVPEETREEVVRRHRRNCPERADSPSPEEDEEGENSNSFPGPPDSQHQVGDNDDEYAAFSRMLQQELDGEGVEGFPTEKQLNAKPRKQRKKPLSRAKTAREVRDRQREKERENNMRKTARQAASNPRGRKVAAGKGKGKGKGKGAKSARGAKNRTSSGPEEPDRHRVFSRNRRDGQDDVGQMILDDLMNHDPISDRMLNPIFNLGPEPAILGNNKQTQLQKLFANIPEGTSTRKAKSDKQQLLQASKSFGYAKVRAKDGKWLVKGMKSTLYHHQLLGAQWMVSRELADAAPYGGLLADGMGLGKTVQTLACMVGNPPTDADKKRNVKATLIVVPSAVIEQWLDEIRNHAEEDMFPKIMHYKTSSKIPTAVLEDLDIVLTSYQQVMKQFPFPDQKARESISQMGYKKWWKKASKTLGDLHKVKWYRVVLDEAHAIKNNSARTSLACQNLNSVYRWCLTGTPLLNCLEE
jgi:SNF2 family DNA or RNA helicase